MRFLNSLTGGVTTTGQITSTVTTGTAPFVIASTTLVSNLNADLLDGQQGSYYSDLGNATGTLAIALGGTNSTATPTNGGVAYGTGSAYAFSAAGTSGQFLKSAGAAAPTWATLAAADIPNLNTSKLTAGTLPIARGGTNSTATPTNGGVAYGTGSAIAYSAVGTSGQPLVSAGAAAPAFGTIQQDQVVSSNKRNCRVATTANITLSGTQTIDGVSVVAGDRVLVKDQSTQSANGIYVCAAGAWSRATDADTASEMSGARVCIDAGTANAGKRFGTNFASTDTLGTTALFWCEEDPIGELIMYSGAATGGSAPFYTSLPAGYALCDGSAISRTTYAKLFAVIGTRYGSGDGSTTFNLPTMTSTLPLGTGSGGAVGNTTYATSGRSADHTHTTTVQYGSSGTSGKTSGGASADHTHNINTTVVMFLIRFA